jgi:predicted nucleic acid-binding protein
VLANQIISVPIGVVGYGYWGPRACPWGSISSLIAKDSFYVSILTKIEFLGWDKHTRDGFEKCERLIETANVLPVDEDIANRTIELKRVMNIKLADAVIAATAMMNSLRLATRNVSDFKKIKGPEVINPLE